MDPNLVDGTMEHNSETLSAGSFAAVWGLEHNSTKKHSQIRIHLFASIPPHTSSRLEMIVATKARSLPCRCTSSPMPTDPGLPHSLVVLLHVDGEWLPSLAQRYSQSGIDVGSGRATAGWAII